MSDLWIIRLLVITTVVLVIAMLLIIKSKASYKRNITVIAEDLRRILDNNTDEKIMLFTDDKALIKLNTQINRILEDRQKNRADYLRAQFSTKRMLSNISHDIRTPMTVIQGYIEILMMNKQNNDEMLKKVDGKVKQLTKLIEEFFTVSKLESGDYPITLARVHCNEICKNSVIGFYDILTEKNFEVDIDIPEQDIFAYADKESIDRIIYNLISNVIRYGFDGKYLKLKLYEDNKGIYIDVIDKGKGIDPISSKHIFDRLYTVDDSRNKDIQGNGLGLTISKGLAEKMGGSVYLSSDPHVKTVLTLKLKKYDF